MDTDYSLPDRMELVQSVTSLPTIDIASYRIADPPNMVSFNADWDVMKTSDYGLFGGSSGGGGSIGGGGNPGTNGFVGGTNIILGTSNSGNSGKMTFDSVFSEFSDSNFSNITTSDDPDFELLYRHSVTMTAVYCVAYIIVFIVGLIGNSFVIAVVLRAPRMRTVTNFFIVNLAVADILVIVFCLPATLMSNIFVPWMLGWLMCKTVPYIQGVSVAASVYSLIAVSLDSHVVHSAPVVKTVVAHAPVVAHHVAPVAVAHHAVVAPAVVKHVGHPVLVH